MKRTIAIVVFLVITLVALDAGARRARSRRASAPPRAGDALPAMPSLGPIDDGSHFTVEGQSNGITFNASPALSTVQEGSNRRAVDETLPALVESSVEGPLAGFLNTMRAICGDGRDFIGSEHNCTSCAYEDIEQGTAQYLEWQGQIEDTNTARGVNPYRWKGSLVVHAENNELEETTSDYCENLITLRTDNLSDAIAVTGQTETAEFFFGMQLGSHVELTSQDYRPCLTCIQVRDCMTTYDRRRFWLVGPGYNYTYQSTGNDVHLINTSARQLGNRAGYVACEVYGNGIDWRPLMITSAVQSGSTITLTYHNPTGTTLVYDTGITARELPGEGFTLVCDDRVDNPTIIGTPTIDDEDTITVSLTQPADVGCSIAYAYNNGRDDVGSTDATAPGGRLRDSNTVQRNSENLYNFAITDKVTITGAVAKSTPDGSITDQRTHTFAWDFVDCVASPDWNWLTRYKEADNTESSHADALTPMQLLLDATDTSYTCDKSTGTLASSAIGASRVNGGVTLAGTGCWRDATGLTAVEPLPDGSDALITAIFEIDGTVGTQYVFIWNAGASEYITLQYSGTTVTTRWRSSEGAEISRATASVPTDTWLYYQAHYKSDCDGGGAGTNPCVDVYLNGTASAGSAHGVNFGQINQPLTGFGLGCDQAGGSNFNGSILWLTLDFGSDMSWFNGETSHDADYAALCASPPCGA